MNVSSGLRTACLSELALSADETSFPRTEHLRQMKPQTLKYNQSWKKRYNHTVDVGSHLCRSLGSLRAVSLHEALLLRLVSIELYRH